MIQIVIPDNNIEERLYALKVVFNTILGVEYNVQPNKSFQTTLICWEGKKLSFKDCFWEMGGININNLPHVQFVENSYVPEQNIPILYGDGSIKIGPDSIECGIDVFASVFFMLTRWEEYVVKKRDKHNRFVGKESVAFKCHFIHRPVVNEYCEMIWSMMLQLGCCEKRKSRKFEIIPTHDIDHPYMRNRFWETSKSIVRCLLDLNAKEIPSYIKNYFIDPYNTYSFLMDVSDDLGVKSHFYLMSSDESIVKYKKSPYFNKRLRHIVNYIEQRGHIIGFHPSFFSVNEEILWKEEMDSLTEFLGQIPNEGRQHYLMFNMPHTFSYWEHNGMNLDSTLSYPDVEGFRCGTGDAFPVYNFLERKEYKLCERPLIIMDGTLMFYQGYSLDKISEVLDYYFEVGKKYKMPITLLFHNSFFIGHKGESIKKIYYKCLLEGTNKAIINKKDERH